MPGAAYQTWWDQHQAARATQDRRHARVTAHRMKIRLPPRTH